MKEFFSPPENTRKLRPPGVFYFHNKDKRTLLDMHQNNLDDGYPLQGFQRRYG